MIYAAAGESFVATWIYEEQLPLEGTLVAELCDNSGAVILHENLPDNATTMTVPATYQVIGVGRAFDNRVLHIRYDTYTGPKLIRLRYRVVDIPLLTVGAQEVRAYIGLQPEELPDRDVDLVSAYFKIEELIQSDRLRQFLGSGTSQELKANELIMLQAVLDLGPSLLQRVAHTMQDANLRLARHAVKNFEDLLGQTAARFAALLAELQPTTAGLSTIPLFTLVPESPDAITGA